MKILSDIFIEVSKFNKNTKSQLKIKQLGFNITKTTYHVKDVIQSQIMNREIGYYTLFDCKDLMFFDEKLKNYLILILKNEIRRFIKLKKIRLKNVLVIGVGNKNYLADCLGDKSVNRIFTTRQLINDNILTDNRFCCVSAYSLSVLGQSGIESAHVVKKLCEIVKPDLIIAVDTFVSSEIKRLGKSLQISSCGLYPGGGVNNNRIGINKAFLKTEVFSIGVPLLISASTFSNKKSDKLKNLVVMDKEIEKYVKFYSTIISTAINLSVNNNVTKKEIDQLIY